MRYTLTEHARKAVEERSIALEWLERTLSEPAFREPDPDDASLERRWYLAIPEHGGRVLRVVVSIEADPERVVSAFFDRSKLGKV